MFARVIEINLQGIDYLRRGKHELASSVFSEALKLILSQLDDMESRQEDSSESSRHIEGSFQSFDIPMDVSLEEPFVLFNRALHVTIDAKSLESCDGCFLYLLLSGTLLYNLGLIHQLAGIRQQSTGLLHKATALYTRAYNALAEQEDTSGLGNLLKLALLNNAGHVYAFLRDSSQAGLCSDELSLLLARSQQTVSSEDFHLFLLNVRFFDRHACASAA